MAKEKKKKKVEWQRDGDGCSFRNLDGVFLQYSSSACHSLALQIVIDACVDYKYKECGSSLMQRRDLLNPHDL